MSLIRPTKKSLVEGVRKQALRQGCSVVLRRFFADFELRQNASGVRYHHHQQHPAAENLTDPIIALLCSAYSRAISSLL